MVKSNYSRYFRVFKNDTEVTEISTNNFKPPKLKPLKKDWLTGDTPAIFCAIATAEYLLLPDGFSFYGYLNRGKAMEMAKAGALKYITSLIDLGPAGDEALLKYRSDHYEDLHINLVYANIEAVKNETA